MKLNRILSTFLALGMVLSPVQVMAAWDSTQPATSAALSSAPVRDNFVAVEGAILSTNHVSNGDLWDWTAGGSAAPDRYTLTGASCTIARTGSGMADTTTFGSGRYAALITRAGTNCVLTNTVISTTDMADLTYTKGKRWHASFLAKSSTASHVRITIDDGVGTTSSDYHTGGGAAEFIVVSRTLDAAATKLEVEVEVNTTDAGAYVGGLAAVPGDIPPSDWIPMADHARFWQAPRWPVGSLGTQAVGAGTLNVNTTTVGNVGGGEDDLMSYSVPADTLNKDGRTLDVFAFGSFANNANSKTWKAYWNGVAILDSGSVAATNERWEAHLVIIRTGSNTQRIFARMSRTTAGGAGTTSNIDTTTGAGTDTGAIVVKFTGTSAASASDDIVNNGMITRVEN